MLYKLSISANKVVQGGIPEISTVSVLVSQWH